MDSNLSHITFVTQGISTLECLFEVGKIPEKHLIKCNHLRALKIKAGQQSITANLWPLTTHIYHAMIKVIGGFSKKYFFIIIKLYAYVLQKQALLKILLFTVKHLCWSLFLIELHALWPAISFQPHPKRNFNTGDSCENCELLTNSIFHGTPPVAAFVSLIK